MTIGKRLIILLAVPLLILVGLGIFIRTQLASIEGHTRFLAETQVVSLAVLGNIARQATELRVEVRSYLLVDDQAARAKTQAAFDSDKTELFHLLRQCTPRYWRPTPTTLNPGCFTSPIPASTCSRTPRVTSGPSILSCEKCTWG